MRMRRGKYEERKMKTRKGNDEDEGRKGKDED